MRAPAALRHVLGIADPDPKIAWLAASPTFAGLSTAVLRDAATCLDEVDWVKPGEVLIRESQPNRAFWMLVEGTVEVSYSSRRLLTHGPGAVLGVPSLLDREPARVTISTLTPIRALVASEQQFVSLLSTPEIELRLRRSISPRLRSYSTAIVGLGTHRRLGIHVLPDRYGWPCR
jgi:CRP-like cAMP-binding protein